MIKKVRFAMMAAFGTICHTPVGEMTLALIVQPVKEKHFTINKYNLMLSQIDRLFVTETSNYHKKSLNLLLHQNGSKIFSES